MASPKSGTAGSAVSPDAPKEALDADTADPGEASSFTAAAAERAKQKYDQAKVKAFKPPSDPAEAKKLSWIEIELVGEDDKGIPGERYRITTPDDSVSEGTLDQNGFARLEGIEPGTCKICFPRLDKDAWEKI